MDEKISATKSKINSLFDQYLKQENGKKDKGEEFEKEEEVSVKEEEEETPADEPPEEKELKEEELKEEEHDDELQPSKKEIDHDLMNAIEAFYADKFKAKEISKEEEEEEAEEEEMSKEQPKEEEEETEVKTTPTPPPSFPSREEPGFISFKNQDDFEKFVSFIVRVGNNQAEKRFRPRESLDNDEGEIITRPEKIRRLETIPIDPFL